MKQLLLFLLLVIFISCSSHDDLSDNPDHSYVVTPRLNSDTTVTVSLTLSNLKKEITTILLPPIYADNPMISTNGSQVTNIKLIAKSGYTIPFVKDTIDIHQFKNESISFKSVGSPVILTYDVSYNFEDTTFNYSVMPSPKVSSSGGYLQGNYLFAVEYNGESLVDLWRSSNSFYVNYNLNFTSNLYGVPSNGWEGENFYQLFFSSTILDGVILDENLAEGQPFQIVAPAPSSFSDVPAVSQSFRKIIDECCAIFGQYSKTPISIIFDVNPGSGLEGRFAFSLQTSSLFDDAPSIFNMVLAHEAVHFWVGVRCGELDDAWWKEGTTNYLGYLISTRIGTTKQSDFVTAIFEDFDTNSVVQTMALSDPSIRHILYEEIKDGKYSKLVYGKGMQINMILDAKICALSKGEKRLEHVVAEIVNKNIGTAFTRAEYLAEIKNITGFDATSFFSSFVDSAGSVDNDTLTAAFDTLNSYGAFGEKISRQIVINRSKSFNQDFRYCKY